MAGVAVRVGDEISGNVKTLKCDKNERGDNDTCESAQIYISQTVRCFVFFLGCVWLAFFFPYRQLIVNSFYLHYFQFA